MRQAEFKAEISVFLALITAVLISLIFAAVENVRTGAAKTYLTVAADSALDSLFSQYHLELWDRYRLLGVEMYSGREVTKEYHDFLKPYLSGGDAKNWYCLSAEEKDITVMEYQLLTDENGAVFEEQVLSYMKCGILLDLAGLDSAGQIAAQMLTAGQVGEMADELETGSRQARKLNESLEDLAEAVTAHNELIPEARNALAEGSQVSKQLKALNKKLEAAQQALSQVRERAQKLADCVEETRAGLEAKKAAGELTEEAFAALDDELESYEQYSSGQGEKSRELDQLEEQITDRIGQMEALLEEAEDAEEYIRNWSPSQIIVGYKPAQKAGEKPEPIYEDEELDRAVVWQSVRELFGEYGELEFVYEAGKIDREKSGKLDRVSDFLKGNLLKTVYPGADRLSKKELDLNGCPSSLHAEEKTGQFSPADYVLNRLAVNEYALMELSNVLKDPNAAEIEYVLCGKKTDQQNVSALVTELVAIRAGLNLLYLSSDTESREAASALAAAVTGGTPAQPIALTAILFAWSTAQGVLDVKELLAGGKVPLMHTDRTFTLSLEGLLNDLPQLLAGAKHSDTGMDYESWLRFLLAFRPGSRTDYRVMDIIQIDLRKEQPDFRMDRLYSAAEIAVDADSGHLFSLWNSSGSGSLLNRQRYSLRVSSWYSY